VDFHRKRISQIRSNRKNFENLISRLERSLSELERLLAEQRSAGGKFRRKKGELPCPVGYGAKCEILRDFGTIKDKRFGTYFFNPGVDILCTEKRLAKAVFDGTVADVVWLPGYKNIVIVRHGGNYYTIYGNIEEVAVAKGQNVSAGDVIGTVASGSWFEDRPTLHFEIRHGREKLNPKEWLRGCESI